jgi:hypothetical protein
MRGGVAGVVGVTIAAAAVWLLSGNADRSTVAVEPPKPSEIARAQPRAADERLVSDAVRNHALVRAQVWRAPDDLSRAEPFRAAHRDEVSCRFVVTRLGGTTPKFDCALANGEMIRVKYGNGAEIPSEAAATRLVRALGFAADTITLVKRLRCFGCPVEPFSIVRAAEAVRAAPLLPHALDYDDYRDFDWVAVERKYDGWPIETATLQGWAFHELDLVEGSKGGAPRAHVDALRLLAAFLAHWDNKSDNQRLVCVSQQWNRDAPCPASMLVLQDLGAAFGPHKVDLEGWTETGIWGDRALCRVSMRGLPYDGATFADVRVGEAGRRFLAERLRQVTEKQIADLFTGARFDQRRGLLSAVHPVDAWVRAFQARVAMITSGPACPPL